MKKILFTFMLLSMFFSFTAQAQTNDCMIVDILVDKENPKRGDKVTIEIETDGAALVELEGKNIYFVDFKKVAEKAEKLYFDAIVLDEDFEIHARANDGVTMIYESGDIE